MGTTTVRSTPNQNQQEKKKEGRDNHAEKKGVVRKKEQKSQNDQEQKQGGLEKEVRANWMEGTNQERRMERGKKEDTRETKRQS